MAVYVNRPLTKIERRIINLIGIRLANDLKNQFEIIKFHFNNGDEFFGYAYNKIESKFNLKVDQHIPSEYSIALNNLNPHHDHLRT